MSIEGLGFIKSRVLFNFFVCGILDGDADMEWRIGEFFMGFGFCAVAVDF